MDKEEGRVRRILFNEGALIAGIVGVAFGIFNMIQAPRNEVEIMKALDNIRDNHIHSIEENVKRIDQANQDQYKDTAERLTRIETILDERLPSKK
jgi:hypothetical protein